MNYGVMGDAHNGFKSYDTNRRTEEVLRNFEAGLEIMQEVPVVFFPGDFFDDTNVSNWVKREMIRIKESRKYYEQIWVILGGNHDSTKTYSSTSALDVFSEVHNVIVINSFEPTQLEVKGIRCLAIPHMKCQKDFIATIDDQLAAAGHFDIIMLHCLVDSNLDLGPNDLNIDMFRLQALRARCDRMFIGHQHEPAQPLPGVYIPGGIIEFDFGQLGDKFVYIIEGDKTSLRKLPVPRQMVRREISWSGAIPLMDELKSLPEDCIVRADIIDIPVDEYSAAKSVADLFELEYVGVLMANLYKTGHREITVTAIDARLDIQDEFGVFCAENKVPEDTTQEMTRRLEDAIGEVLAEEE